MIPVRIGLAVAGIDAVVISTPLEVVRLSRAV